MLVLSMPLLKQSRSDGCLQVLAQDIDPQYGIAHSPLGPSPSQSPIARPFGAAPTAPPSAYTSAVARSSSLSNSGNLSRLSRGTSQDITDPKGGAPDPTTGEALPMQGSSSSPALSRRHSGHRQYSGADHMGSGALPAVAEAQSTSERTDSETLSVETASQDLTVPSQPDSSEWAHAEASDTGSQTGGAIPADEEAPRASGKGRRCPDASNLLFSDACAPLHGSLTQ